MNLKGKKVLHALIGSSLPYLCLCMSIRTLSAVIAASALISVNLSHRNHHFVTAWFTKVNFCTQLVTAVCTPFKLISNNLLHHTRQLVTAAQFLSPAFYSYAFTISIRKRLLVTAVYSPSQFLTSAYYSCRFIIKLYKL